MRSDAYRLSLILQLLIFLLFIGTAAAGEVDDVVSKLQKNYQEMNDYRASFLQETKIQGYPRPQRSAGEVFYRKPGKMRWNYSTPEKQEIVTDGRTVWLYTPALNQVMQADFAATNQSKVAAAFLSGMGNLKRDFIVLLDEPAGPDDDYRVVLKPKEDGDTMKSLILTVDRKSCHIKRSELLDIYDNITVVTLTDFRVNLGLKNSMFEFQPPKGVEIVSPPDLR